MNIKLILLGIVGVILFLGLTIGGWIWGTYNDLVTQRENVTTSWAQVETQYQRRFDLVPNLASATKGYMAHEQKVFADIAEARTHYAGAASGSDEKVQATSQFEGALSRLMVIMENYPNLKADQTVKGLTDELAGTENRINVARERYNETARDYNITIKRFPASMIAGMFQFKEKPLFTVQNQEANQAPKVDLEVK